MDECSDSGMVSPYVLVPSDLGPDVVLVDSGANVSVSDREALAELPLDSFRTVLVHDLLQTRVLVPADLAHLDPMNLARRQPNELFL